ncbi:MAG: SseB family protein [Nocardioides sp.]
MSERPVPDPSGGKSIPEPGFAGDLGEPDPEVRAALAAHAADPADPNGHVCVLTALSRARLLVPVVAILGEVEHDAHGPAREKTSDMATVLLAGRDGRQALLGFTGLDSLAAWRPDGRPVPVTARDAARSALQEGAALLLDVAGPTPYAVEGEALKGLARGWTLVQTPTGPAWAEPAPQE